MHLLPTPDIMRPLPPLMQSRAPTPKMHLLTYEKHSVQWPLDRISDRAPLPPAYKLTCSWRGRTQRPLP